MAGPDGGKDEAKGTPEIEKLVDDTVKDTIELAVASTEKLVVLYIKHAVMLFFVFSLGALLLYARYAIFWLIPQLVKVAVPLAIALDAFLTAASAELAVLTISWDIIRDVVVGFTAGLKNLGPISATPKLYTWSPADVTNALNTFAATCSPYDSLAKVAGQTIRVLLGPYICPVLRYVYPVPWLFDTLNFLLGWASPDPTPAGFDGENNCKDDPEDYSWVCAAIGSGYVILEVLLPIFVGIIFLEAIFVPLIKVLYDLFKWQDYIGSIGFKLAADGLLMLDNSVSSLANAITNRRAGTSAHMSFFSKSHGE